MNTRAFMAFPNRLLTFLPYGQRPAAGQAFTLRLLPTPMIDHPR
jgi:hypothetical protein